MKRAAPFIKALKQWIANQITSTPVKVEVILRAVGITSFGVEIIRMKQIVAVLSTE